MPDPVGMRVVSGEERVVTQGTEACAAPRQSLGEFVGEWQRSSVTVTAPSRCPPGLWALHD